MPLAAFHTVCTEILQEYIHDPWRWLRENDLVVDVVTRVRDRLATKTVEARLRGKGFDSRLTDRSTSYRSIPRVRTEVKVAGLVGAEPDRDRSDICVLVDDHVVDLFIHEKGARDVVLEVSPPDVSGLLEVKLYSDLYLGHDMCGWLEDVVKLSQLPTSAVRGVLYVDTGLPLDTIAVNYRQKRNEGASMRRAAGRYPPWPHREGQRFQVQYTDRSKRKYTATFEPVARPQDSAPHLWALALRADSTWEPEFVARTSTLLPTADVVPTCWRVSFESA